LESIAHFVAHVFTRQPAGFAAAQFADMKLGNQGSNHTSDQGYDNTMEPPRPAPSVEFDQCQPSAEDGKGYHNANGKRHKNLLRSKKQSPRSLSVAHILPPLLSLPQNVAPTQDFKRRLRADGSECV
jgi:hypothetical protein